MLPAKRTPITLLTSDGLRLVGELAVPADADPVGTLIWLHPLPTHGGMMDSHLLKKAAFRLPALAQLAVLRFNTRGTSSWQGTSEGEFDAGEAERHDVSAAVTWALDAGLPARWLVGWSFGTELALKWGLDADASARKAAAPDGDAPPRRTAASRARSCCRPRCAGPATPTWTGGPRRVSRWWRWSPSLTITCVPTRPGGGSPVTRRPRSSPSPGPSTCGSASRTCASR